MTVLVHAVTITPPGKTFTRTFKLPFAPTNGLRISLGEEASFIVQDLVFHVDAANFSCVAP